jgi:hypothetical protein
MRGLLIATAVFLVGTAAQASADTNRSAFEPRILLAGNTSTNTSTNTSNNTSSRGSSYTHTHNWSVDSDDGRRRRSVGGTTRIERYESGNERRYRRRRD